MPTDIERLPEKIKKNPHWRVNFRPTSHKTRFENPNTAFNLIQQGQLNLRGWPYPFISDERREQIRAQKYIASGSDFEGFVEYWRIYYSGQFINLFTVREKMNQSWDEKLRKEASQLMFRPADMNAADIPGFINIINLLYHLTEIFEFAARLCSKKLYDTSLEITVELHNVKGFALIAEFPRHWSGYYPATADAITKSVIFESEQLLARSAEFALDWSVYFFSLFGWDNPPIDFLKGDQQKFLSGKI
ncbi:hypothetical protein ES703_97137 [subsurface metagenome]